MKSVFRGIKTMNDECFDDHYDGGDYYEDYDIMDDEEEKEGGEELTPVTSHDEFLKTFKPHTDAHSAYVASNLKGNVVCQSKKDYCYSDIFCVGCKLSRITLFFGKDKIKEAYDPELWCDWVINKSQYKDAFLTKDAGVGLDEGFEVNTKAPIDVMKAGMMCLRHFAEFNDWSWIKLLGLGFDEWESYALATHFNYNEEGGFYQTCQQSNHTVVEAKSQYRGFLGELRSNLRTECVYDDDTWNKIIRISSNWSGNYVEVSWPKKKIDSTGFFGEDITEETNGITKEQLTAFLNQLKGI